MRTSVIDTVRCPGCGHESQKVLNRSGDRPAKPGDYQICHRCAAINIFTQEMSLREASTPERARLYNSPLGAMASQLRAEVLFPQRAVAAAVAVPAAEPRAQKKPSQRKAARAAVGNR